MDVPTAKQHSAVVSNIDFNLARIEASELIQSIENSANMS